MKQGRAQQHHPTHLRADRMHFWPYGLNFDNESDKKSDLRHVKMVEAARKDMGIR